MRCFTRKLFYIIWNKLFMVDTLRENSGFLIMNAQYWTVLGPSNWVKNGRFMMRILNDNKIIKLVQLEIYFEFFLIWSLSTNVIKGADLSNDLSLYLLSCFKQLYDIIYIVLYSLNCIDCILK